MLIAVTVMPVVFDTFLRSFADRAGWKERSGERLRSAGEETLAILLQQFEEEGTEPQEGSPIVTARLSEKGVELDSLAASGAENLQDRLACLSEQPELVDEHEIFYRLLRHYASSVGYEKYHDVDIVSVLVEEAP